MKKKLKNKKITRKILSHYTNVSSCKSIFVQFCALVQFFTLVQI